jgi:hypothetical protein
MNTRIIRRLIVATIVLQFLWFACIPAGNRLAPKSPEMAQALRVFETNRSVAAKAAMWDQVSRDDLRDFPRKGALFSLMLLADAAVIYLFWNYETKKTANKSHGER